MSGKRRESRELAQGEVSIERFVGKTGPKKVQRFDEGGGTDQGARRNR